MKYIKNNLGYAVSFKVEEKTYEFDCERIYRDTGRIALTESQKFQKKIWKSLTAVKFL